MAVRQETLGSPVLRDTYRLEGEDFFEDGDEFEDATDDDTVNAVDLKTAFEDCEQAIKKFFSNDLVGAMNLMKHWDRTSLYHSLGTAMFEFIPAMLSFDHGQIHRTQVALKRCISICNQHRRSFTLVEHIGTIIKKHNYATYTDLEAHAQLCYAEALLLQAAMTIMEGEDLAGLIKGTIKVKNCYSTYKECAKIVNKKQWDSEQSRIQFQSGVRLGIATFNVMISLLPPRIISLLEFVGFSGNKALGLKELEAGSMAPGMRSVLCDLTLLGYHLVICHFIGAPSDLSVCEEILRKQLKTYPASVWFLMFKGRLELMRGQFEPAIGTYRRAIESQDKWLQFRHVCYWEIMWVHSLQMEWREAAMFANKLMEESSWSKTIYSYTKAALLLQIHGGDPLCDEKHQCDDLLRNASYYKQRIAGKSLPMEKFVIKRCARYQMQGGRLVLPAIELLCLWNMFHILGKNERQAQNILRLIERTQKELEVSSCKLMDNFAADNNALLWFLRGCCLAAMNLPLLAIDSLESVFKYKQDIKEDTFLIPYSIVEIAMCHYRLGDKDLALQMLLNVRKKYSGYSLESRLHFRLHSKIEIIKTGLNADPLAENNH